MNTASRIIALSLLLTLTAVNAQNIYKLTPASSFGGHGDGSIRPGDSIGTNPQSGNNVAISAPITFGVNYGIQPGDTTASPANTNGYNMRGLAFDPITHNLVFVDTHTGQNGANVMVPNSAVYILDSTSGQILTALNTNNIIDTTGGIGCVSAAGVADDGVVYVCNQINNANAGAFEIHRWPTANINAPNINEVPAVAFSNILEITERVGQTLDVRGAGANTQIIVGSSAANGPGTNCWLFTTADGTNFVQHRLYFPGITTANFNDGITFGRDNSFFAKQVGKPLLFLSWDPNTFVGSVIAIYPAASPTDPLINQSGITYDKNTGLLASLEEIGGTATGGPGKVWIFDFPNPSNRPPAVLDSSVFPANFPKTTAPMGYVHFGANGRIYAHASNNGFLVNDLTTDLLQPPTFNQDLPATVKVAATQTAHLEVQAVYDVTNYTWYSNNVVMPTVTTYFMDITNAQSSLNNTVFKVVVQNAAGTATSTACTLKVVSSSDFFHLTSLWTALGTATNYVTAGGGGTPAERCIAYNALSNQLLVVRGVAGTIPKVFVVDATTGAYLYQLSTNAVGVSGAASVSGGTTLTLCGIGVADDGAVYACNVASDATFKVYRWANAASNTVAQIIFGTNSTAGSSNPMADQLGSTTYRFGDNLAVHGSGMNTEIVMDAQNAPQFAAILFPIDSTMTNWVSHGYLMQNTPGSYGYGVYGTSIGRSLQFGQNSTFWQKRYNAAAGAPLSGMSYTTGGGLAFLAQANTSLPLYTNGSVGINFQLSLAAAINFVGGIANDSTTAQDQLALYDFTDPRQSVLLNQQTLVGANIVNGNQYHKGNNNAVGQVLFGTSATSSSNYLFVLNACNGINTYVLEGGAVPPPKVLSQPQNVKILTGSSGGIGVTLDQPCNVVWYKGTNPPVSTGVVGTAYTVNAAASTDVGDYFAIASNNNGSVTTLVAHINVADSSGFPTLTQVWAATAGNATFPYITSAGGANTPGERAFAYNPVANQLIVVHCPPASTAYSLAVVEANTGNQLYTMNTTGVLHEGASEVSGSNPIDLVGAACADDGALYITSETPNASGGVSGDPAKMLHIFRWANTGQTTTPTLIFEGDPSSQPPGSNLRWGDVLSARGTGTNTELFLNSFEGSFGAVLRPTSSAMTTFTNLFFEDAGGAGSIGRSVQFGVGTNVFEKRRGAAMIYSTYDLTNQIANVVYATPSSTTLGAVAVDLTHNIMAGVDFVGALNSKPDVVSLYDITDPTTPLLLAQYPFPQNQIANANSICQTIIAGNRVYALDANNGLVAFNIVPGNVAPPVLSITLSGNNAIVSWPQQGSFTLQGVNTLSGSPIPWSDIGTGTAVNGNYVVTNSISATATFYRLRQ